MDPLREAEFCDNTNPQRITNFEKLIFISL